MAAAPFVTVEQEPIDTINSRLKAASRRSNDVDSSIQDITIQDIMLGNADLQLYHNLLRTHTCFVLVQALLHAL